MHLTDDNILSVLTYAIAEVGVEHVIVAGHTNCGGANACIAAASMPPSEATTPLARWLAPLTSVAADLQSSQPNAKLTSLELVEANVRLGVENVLKTDAVRNAWSPDASVRGKAKLVGVHGVVYELETGRVRDLKVSAVA